VAVDEAIVSALSGFSLDTGRSYTAQVHAVLQQAIVRGKLLPKTALSEATISSLIEVSRTPVREALAQLADEQLVLIYRQVGTIVAFVRLSLLEEGASCAAPSNAPTMFSWRKTSRPRNSPSLARSFSGSEMPC